MKLAKIKEIAERISKEYAMPMPIVKRVKGNCGDSQVEIRSELTLDEGGFKLMDAVPKIDVDYICEAQAGCVYRVYQSK